MKATSVLSLEDIPPEIVKIAKEYGKWDLVIRRTRADWMEELQHLPIDERGHAATLMVRNVGNRHWHLYRAFSLMVPDANMRALIVARVCGNSTKPERKEG